MRSKVIQFDDTIWIRNVSIAAVDPVSMWLPLAVMAVAAIVGIWLVGELVAKLIGRWRTGHYKAGDPGLESTDPEVPD